jgi:tRNA threonylcarbamoyladenosine biosynthesis protein TsaE
LQILFLNNSLQINKHIAPLAVYIFYFCSVISFNLNTIDAAVTFVMPHLQNTNCIALYGEMGAGKTTFTNALCLALNVTEKTSSPTFSIVNEYKGILNNKPITIYHIDWYRLKNADDIINAGVAEHLQEADALCIIEWPSIAEELLPMNCLKLKIRAVSETERIIEII